MGVTYYNEGDVDYWDTVWEGHPLRLQRRWIFWWAIAWKNSAAYWPEDKLREYGIGRDIFRWKPLQTFWSKKKATAKLMELMLRGHNVQL